MDRARFDALARLLATGGSRRGALGALLSVTLLGQDPDALAKRGKHHPKNTNKNKNKKKPARGDGQDPDGKGVQGEGRPGAAHKKHHGKQKTKRKRRKQRRQQDRQQDPRPPVGGGPGDPCADPGDCADELCQTKACVDFLCVYTDVSDGPSPNRLCDTHCCQGACCAAGATECNPSGLCCAPNCAGRQCGPDGCGGGGGGTCGACPPGEVCDEDSGQCSCDGARCAAACCAPGQVCDLASSPNRCCTPEPRATTCPVDTCGEVRNNCGEEVDCGACEPIICFTGTCHADTHRCTYAGDPNGQPGTLCPAPRVCCADQCCPAHQVCDVSGPISICCTPEPAATTCHPPGGTPRCGMAPNNCGQDVNCGACEEVACQTGTCSAADHHCTYVTNPNLTPCSTGTVTAGVCCDGQCVPGDCCTTADCTGVVNACTEHTCTCGGGPACTRATERCCGASPGGTCVHDQTDPTNCGGCGHHCPAGTCQVATCTHGVCGTAPVPDDTNPGGACPGSEVCCSGACTDRSTNHDHCGTCNNPCNDRVCATGACFSGMCQTELTPRGQPGPFCPDGQCCTGTCCTNPTPVCDQDICIRCINIDHCGPDQGCCPAGICCDRGHECCSDHCCDAGQVCCDSTLGTCCGGDQVCCGDHCCGADQTCCGDHCCDAGHTCCGLQCLEGSCCPAYSTGCDPEENNCCSGCIGEPPNTFCCGPFGFPCTTNSQCCTGNCDAGHCGTA
jgi:hypothetical protein